MVKNLLPFQDLFIRWSPEFTVYLVCMLSCVCVCVRDTKAAASPLEFWSPDLWPSLGALSVSWRLNNWCEEKGRPALGATLSHLRSQIHSPPLSPPLHTLIHFSRHVHTHASLLILLTEPMLRTYRLSGRVWEKDTQTYPFTCLSVIQWGHLGSFKIGLLSMDSFSKLWILAFDSDPHTLSHRRASQ